MAVYGDGEIRSYGWHLGQKPFFFFFHFPEANLRPPASPVVSTLYRENRRSLLGKTLDIFSRLNNLDKRLKVF